MKNDVTVLVNSCDLYEDAWNPFFSLFHTYWKDCPYQIALNTENKDYSHPDMNIRVFHEGSTAWSNRLIKVIKQIDSEYILMFLEDFFLMSEVDVEKFNEALRIMQNDPNVGVVDFIPDINDETWPTGKRYSENYAELTKGAKWRLNCIAALWRKDFLLKVIRKNESPWQFEIHSSFRAKRMEEVVLCQVDYGEKPVFDFHLWEPLGYGISKKTWLPKNKELFEAHGIKVDFENLGWYPDPSQTVPRRTKKELIKMSYTHPLQFLGLFCKKVYEVITKAFKSLWRKIRYLIAWF